MKLTFFKSANAFIFGGALLVLALVFLSSSQAFAAERVPMIRMYNPAINDHFYTSNRQEANEAAARHGYRLEGEMGYMYKYEQANNEPVYRMWNPQAKKHFYTTSKQEMETVRAGGFNLEGVLGYVPNLYAGGGEVGLVRLYSPREQKHFYTTSVAESNMLATKGYVWEGYLGHGLFAGDVSYDYANADFISTSTQAINAEQGKQGRWPMSFQYKGPGPITLNWSVTNLPKTMYLENNGPITLNNNDFFTMYLGGSIDELVSIKTLELHLTTSRGYSESFDITYSTTGANFGGMSVNQGSGQQTGLISLVPDWSKSGTEQLLYGAGLQKLIGSSITKEQVVGYYSALLARTTNAEVGYVATFARASLDASFSDVQSAAVKGLNLYDIKVYPNYYPVKVYSLREDTISSVIIKDIVCPVVIARFGLECDYGGSLAIDYSKHKVLGSLDQYDAEGLMQDFQESIPQTVRKNSLSLLFFSGGLKPDNYNYVVSWQDVAARAAIISDAYFLPDLGAIGQNGYVRRMVIKTLGSISVILGYNRPTNSICPGAYFDTIELFTEQKSILCGETIQQHVSRTAGVTSRPLSETEMGQIILVAQLLLMDRY